MKCKVLLNLFRQQYGGGGACEKESDSGEYVSMPIHTPSERLCVCECTRACARVRASIDMVGAHKTRAPLTVDGIN